MKNIIKTMAGAFFLLAVLSFTLVGVYMVGASTANPQEKPLTNDQLLSVQERLVNDSVRVLVGHLKQEAMYLQIKAANEGDASGHADRGADITRLTFVHGRDFVNAALKELYEKEVSGK